MVFTPHPCPSPHAAIRNRTEAWGEGAPLTAQVESVRVRFQAAGTILCRRCDIKSYGIFTGRRFSHHLGQLDRFQSRQGRRRAAGRRKPPDQGPKTTVFPRPGGGMEGRRIRPAGAHEGWDGCRARGVVTGLSPPANVRHPAGVRLPHSKTRSVFRNSEVPPGFGVRQPPGAFPRRPCCHKEPSAQPFASIGVHSRFNFSGLKIEPE
jgi:hypothetical protein